MSSAGESVVPTIAETTSTKTPGLYNVGGRFAKGNPGRPKGTRNVTTILEEAQRQANKTRERLKEPCSCVFAVRGTTFGTALPQDPVKRQQVIDAQWLASCKTINEHFARQAYRDPTVLSAFIRKQIPDLQHSSSDVPPSAINIHYGHQGASRTVITQPLEANGH